MEEQRQLAGYRGVGTMASITGTPAVIQNIQNVQVCGAPLSITAGAVHNHVHHHHAGNASRFPPGWDHVENYRQIQIATLGKATRGTGVWIRQMKTWGIWLDSDGFLKIMWGYGMPGAGKTILASIVIDTLEAHARASTPICINYIYFRYSDHTKATLRGFLESLVKQTVERHSHCLPLFDELFAGHIHEKTQPSEEELLSLYKRLLGTMTHAFCILDALDEAPIEIQLEILEKLASLDLKLFITSRAMPTVEKHFPEAHRFRVFAQDQDIDLHIDKVISNNADLREVLDDGGSSLRTEITASIKEKCGGMFLHVALHLEALRECTSIHEVKEALATFPTTIEDLYLQTWQRITLSKNAKSGKNREMVADCFLTKASSRRRVVLRHPSNHYANLSWLALLVITPKSGSSQGKVSYFMARGQSLTGIFYYMRPHERIYL